MSYYRPGSVHENNRRSSLDCPQCGAYMEEDTICGECGYQDQSELHFRGEEERERTP